MKGGRVLVNFLGGLSLLSLFATLTVTRPWQPAIENRVANGYFTHIQRQVSISWHDFPHFGFTDYSYTHCTLCLSPEQTPQTSTQTLSLGFLTLERTEERSLSPCGSAPVR